MNKLVPNILVNSMCSPVKTIHYGLKDKDKDWAQIRKGLVRKAFKMPRITLKELEKSTDHIGKALHTPTKALRMSVGKKPIIEVEPYERKFQHTGSAHMWRKTKIPWSDETGLVET